jgi:glycosyltransferase involved in cell wall biosynthesis
MPIKILFIPEYWGGNSYQKILADSLAEKGFEVCFGSSYVLFSILKSAKNHWKPNIIHLQWAHPFILAKTRIKTIIESVSFIGEFLILKLLRIKIVWTVHSIVSHEKEFPHLELFFNQLIAHLCNKIIVHSSFAKKMVIIKYKVGESLIRIIPHVNYIHWYENKIAEAQAREKLQLSKKDIVFLHFRLIRPYKGAPELIGAFKKLTSRLAKLLIAGKPLDNEVATDLQIRCEENENIITILEFIPDNELQLYMNAANFLVLPYRDILTSGAIILAMSFSKAIIAPKIGCISEILHEQEGFCIILWRKMVC